METKMGNRASETARYDERLSAAAVSEQIDSILRSEIFKTSESLRALLVFFGRLYAEKSDGVVSEYELAVSVFGRGSDFDSRIDSVVRVHTGRLRSRLAEYYMADGNVDDVLVGIPKGHYCLVARRRQSVLVHDVADSGTDHELPPAENPVGKLARFRKPVLVAVAGLALVAVGIVLDRSLQFAGRPRALDTFWKDFIRQPAPPLVIFSNPRFAGSSNVSLHLFRPGIDSAGTVNEMYSGSGEVVGAHRLTATFAALHSSILVKRAQLLTWDEVDGRGLIFLGAPAQNLPTHEVRIDGFRFERHEEANAIINEKPAAGEPAVYLAYGPPYASDYTIIAYTDSPNRAYPAMVLAGTTTYGTQAAAEFVTREDMVSELLNKLHVRSGQTVPHFIAILEVKVINGAVIQSRVVLLRANNRTQKSQG